MSRKITKAGAAADMDFSALDQELALMARETPEIPADFHDRWIQAIRKEAAGSGEASGEETKTAGESRKLNIIRQRRYILSAAAAFVVLIGGVAYYLSAGNRTGDLLNRDIATEKPAAEQAAPEPVPAPETETAMEPEEDMEAEAAYSAADEPAYAIQAESVYEVPSESVYEAPAESSGMLSAFKSENVMADRPYAAGDAPAAEAEAAGGWADETMREEPGILQLGTFVSDLFAGQKTADEEKPAATAEPEATAAPAETAEPHTAADVIPLSASAKEGRKNAGPETEAEEEEPSFLQNLWTFILRATPWILGAAVVVLFLVTNIIRNGKKKP